jgi:acetyltransferase-like isoleucine patch superfamily enzyme
MAMIRPSGYYGNHIGDGLRMGDGSNIGAYSYIGCAGMINIGKNVMMGPRVSLLAEQHVFEDTGKDMKSQGVRSSGIVIEDDCWLGAGVMILDGVTIGTGSIVAAGAVVTKSVEPYSIVGGVPAKLIRSRGNT